MPDTTSKNRRSTPPTTTTTATTANTITTTVRHALALPPKWIATYDHFVTKNAGQVAQMESALRSLTYIIPGNNTTAFSPPPPLLPLAVADNHHPPTGRFRDAELATEGIHSGVQLLSLYHDLLLFRSSLQLPPPSSSSSSSPSLARSLHARYTRFWAARSALYRRVAVVLQVVQYTELLLEMWAKRRGEAVRWRVVVAIEAVKAVCRLWLLRITRARPLVTPALPERERVADAEEEEEEEEENANGGRALAELMGEEEEEDEEQEHAAAASALENGSANGSHDGSNGNGKALVLHHRHHHHHNGHTPPPSSRLPPPPNVHNPKRAWPMRRTGLTLPSLPAGSDVSSYLLTRVLTADDIKPATKLLRSLRGRGGAVSSAHAAEILYILAPLVYAVALARTSSPQGRRSAWTPWLVGLLVQVAARQLAAHWRGGGENNGNNSHHRTALEKEEWARRGRQMWWWLMRGAAYENVVKGVVGGVRRRVPGFVGTILEDYEYLWENYYFSTSDS